MTNTTTTLAAALETTPRTLRKFLRSPESGIESVGKGSRYALPSSKREVTALGKRFSKWESAQDEARKARKAAQDAPEAPATIEPDVDEVETDFDSLECPLDA